MSDLPPDVIKRVERLTRLARDAVDPAESSAYRRERDELVAENEYTLRIREDDDADVLVCYPSEWMEDGTVQTDRIDDVDRGVERRVSGAGDPDDWEAVADANDEIVEAVAQADEEVHAENVRALSTFASNHYAKPIRDLTRAELRGFTDEYLPRNAWPTDRQLATVEDSIERAFEKTEVSCPLE